MRKLTKDEVKFELEIESEDLHLQVRGNYMCTSDPESDKKAEDEILARLERGDIYAWCVIKVTAKWEGFEGFATIGGVSFSEDEDGDKQAENEAESYGLHEEALDQLNKGINAYVMNGKDIELKLS